MAKSEYVLEAIEDYDYELTKENVDKIFERYRSYIDRKKSILAGAGRNMDFDGLGIYSGKITDKTASDGEKLAKYDDYIDKVKKVYSLNKDKLSEDENKIYKYYLEKKLTNDELCSLLHISETPLIIKKKNCILKVALWYGVIVEK